MPTGRPRSVRATIRSVTSSPSSPPWNAGRTTYGISTVAGRGAASPVSRGSTASSRTPGARQRKSAWNSGASSTIERNSGVSVRTSTGPRCPTMDATASSAAPAATPQPTRPGAGYDTRPGATSGLNATIEETGASGVPSTYVRATSAPSLSATIPTRWPVAAASPSTCTRRRRASVRTDAWVASRPYGRGCPAASTPAYE